MHELNTINNVGKYLSFLSSRNGHVTTYLLFDTAYDMWILSVWRIIASISAVLSWPNLGEFLMYQQILQAVVRRIYVPAVVNCLASTKPETAGQAIINPLVKFKFKTVLRDRSPRARTRHAAPDRFSLRILHFRTLHLWRLFCPSNFFCPSMSWAPSQDSWQAYLVQHFLIIFIRI